MKTMNVHEAKTHLYRLIDAAVKGEKFVIATSGIPLVRMADIDILTDKPTWRNRFIAGRIKVPDDFDRMGAEKAPAPVRPG